MKITPLEIRQKTFEKAFRGLDKDEVNAFLQSLSHEWERMLDENKDIKIRLNHAEKEVTKLREVENTLFKTLKTAEDTSANVIEQAKKTAELHLKETQINSDALLNESKLRAKAIIERADSKSMQIVMEMQDEIKNLEENYRIIESHRDSLTSQLKLFSSDVMEKVVKLNSKDENKGIEGHLKKVKMMMRESSEKAVSEPEIELAYIKPKVAKPIATPKSISDEQRVKMNHIIGNEPIERRPIERTPIQKTTKVIEAVNQDDLSFFDQLED